jgi:uncharacterized repeat protein (TIGR01451 family)
VLLLGSFAPTLSAAPEAKETSASPPPAVLGALVPLLSEDFESWPPAGWTIVDNGGSCVWESTATTGRTNYAGGDGNAAVADADWCFAGMDTELQTPSLDLSTVVSATLGFAAAYDDWSSDADYFEVNVSDDGGSSWTQELHWTTDHSAGGPGETVTIDLSPYVGSSSVIVSFHYYAPGWDWWAMVDEVVVTGEKDAALTPLSQSDAGCQGTDVTYDLDLINQSGYTDTFDIATTGNQWDTTLSDTSLTLPDGVSATLGVTVTVPSYAFTGDVDTVEIQATGQTTPTLAASATIETTAGNLWLDGESNAPALWPAYASDGSALYTFDGLNASGSATDQTQVFDPGSGWATGAGHGLGGFYGGVAGYSGDTGQFYYAPGFVDGMSAVSTFVDYDPATDAWTSLTARPEALGLGAGGVTADGQSFVWAGGSPDAGLLDYTPVYTYDVGADTWFTATTLADVGFTAPGYVMVGDQLYVGGSYLGGDAFYVYDVGDDTWTRLADLPTGRVSPLFIYEPGGNDVYMVGGGSLPSTATSETYVYDVDTDAWEPFADLNHATLGNGGGYLAGTLYTFGGGADVQAAHNPAPLEYALPQCPDLTLTDLTGQVTNGVTGDPIAGATVEAVGTGYTVLDDATPVAWTDANGVYTLTLYAPATYDVTASSGSFDPRTESIDMTVAGPNEQDFVLGPPLANVSPLSYIATIPWAETEVQTMTLANDGYSELVFELVEENGGYEVSPLSMPAFTGEVPTSAEPASIGRAPVDATGPIRTPGTNVLGPHAGEPAYAINVSGPDLNYIPDTAAPGTWNVLDSLSATYWAGDFLNGDFSQLYAIRDTNNLYVIDTATGAETLIGPSVPNSGESWTGMTAAADGTLYAVSTNCGGNSTLHTVDPGTGTATPIANTGLGCIIDVAINAHGDMYALDIVDNQLYEIDPATAAATAIGSVGFDANFGQGMEFDESSGVLYLAAFNYNTLQSELRIADTSTGNSALVGAFPNPGSSQVDCLAFPTSSSGGDIPWLSEDPITGTVPLQDVIYSQLTFDAGAVTELGTYTGTLTLDTNDPDVTTVEMPVQLNVVDNPDAGLIEGTVTSDRPGGPVEGASVFLEAASGLTDTVTTDAAGAYERLIHPDDLGTFTITVSAPDYLTDVATTTVGTATVVHDVELVYNGPEMAVAPDAISETVTWGEVATTTMTIANDGETDLDYDVYDYTVLYAEDFEADDGGYTVAGTNPSWQWGEPASGPDTAHSGLNVWATSLSGSYNNSESSYLESPDIDLSAYAGTGFTVEWWEYVEVEPVFDAWYVEASNDGGETWATVYGWYTGSTGGWINPSVSLSSSYAVSSFRLRFGLYSDSSFTYPGYYVDDVRITADPPWKSESVNSGTVVSHTAETITVTLDSTLAPGPGVYEAVEDVVGNDVLNPQEIVPVTFTVLDNPDQAYLSGTILGNRTAAGIDLPLDGALVQVETVTNTFQVETDAAGFYELTILPSITGTYTVTVSYPGYHDDQDTVVLDNGDELTHDVTLELIGPYLNADPETIAETLPWGGDVDVTLTISNPLPANAVLDVSISELAGSYTPPTVQTVQVDVAEVSPSALSDEADYLVPPATRPARTIDVSLQNLALGQIDVLIVSADVGQGNSLDGFDQMLAAFPDLTVDVHPVDAVPDLSELTPYDVVFVGNNNNWPIDNEALGDVLADYVDGGGKVVLAQATMYVRSGTNFELGGRWEAGGYSPLTYADTLAGAASLGVYQAAHPIMADVASVDDYVVHGVGHGLQSGAEAVALWNDGEIYVAALPDVVAFNQLLTNGNDWDGDVPTLVHNAILYLAPTDVPWLSESPTDVTLGVGEQASTTIGLDASTVDQPGTYNAWLWLENNDPLQTGATIPVEMTVEVDSDMGVLRGVVTMDRHALGLGLPAEDATVVLTDALGTFTTTTDASGEFIHFYESGALPLDVDLTARYPDYHDDTAAVTLNAGETVTADMEVRLMEPWIHVTPHDRIEVTVVAGDTATDRVTVENAGMTDLDVSDVLEIPPGSPLDTQGEAQGNETWVGDPFTVDAAVADELDVAGEADFFIWMRQRADLGRAYALGKGDVRRQVVYDALTRTAARSQAEIIDYLESRGIPYESFWINNAILVRGGDQAVIDFVTSRRDVARIRGVYTRMFIPDPEQREIVTRDANGPSADPTWNVDVVDAPEVWSQLNVTGDGVVVANIDTGVRYTHEALVDSYRGNLGGGTFDHNYNWGSIYGNGPTACAGAETAPCDWSGHGTHTMGTMVGGDGHGPFDMDVGIAPDARWMACMGCDTPPDQCTDAALTGCAEWILAPLDLDGQNPDPTRAPDVVNNSWGGPGEDPWYYSFVEAWNAANIIPVFSAGNTGPGCGTLGSPGSYDNVIAVGGTDSADYNYTYTSRGPGSGTGVFPVQKPDIAAPGEGVPSAVASGDGDYVLYSGTSMAAPHVAGLSALLRSVDPTLDRETIWEILTTSAVTDTLALKNGTWCGSGPDFPNQVFGHGRIDAFTSVQAVLADLDIPWLAVTPTSGVVQPAGVGTSAYTYTASMPLDLTFDAAGLGAGVYTGTLRLLHNDPLTGQIDVAVQMTVVTYEPVLSPKDDAAAGDPGTTVPYTLTLTNDGTTTDTFDLTVSGNAWTATHPASVGPLAAGESEDVTIEVEIPFSAHGGDQDVATVSATSRGDPAQSASATLTTTVTDQPVVLVVAKTADPGDVVDPGDPVTYTITVSNDGHDPVAVVLSDQVPTHTTYVQGSVTGGLAYTEMPAQVAWDGTIDPGAERTFTFQVAVDEDAPPGGWITNTVVALVDGEEYIEQVEVRIRPLIYLPIVLNRAD